MEPQEDQYWTLVEKLVEQANAECENLDPGVVNAAFMQAAARFNAFYIAASSESRNDLKEDKSHSIKDFSDEYKELLTANLEDYIENYKVYMRE